MWMGQGSENEEFVNSGLSSVSFLLPSHRYFIFPFPALFRSLFFKVVSTQHTSRIFELWQQWIWLNNLPNAVGVHS